MKSEFDINTERGYTLIETVIAMALFLSVLIPLIGTMGTMMFDRKAITATKALILAQSEMSTTITHQDYIDAVKTSEAGYILVRKIERYNSLVQIRITVKSSADQSKELIVLKKIVYE
ncbi:MAG: prepilin-type N-terminal cleavage/methylation domain-containing protein [Bacteroidota bacterium]|jgi:prepilin-type N-terminal cleavage/methylation domain-containing protein